MSFVNVDPFGMLAAAATLESLGSHMAVSNAAGLGDHQGSSPGRRLRIKKVIAVL